MPIYYILTLLPSDSNLQDGKFNFTSCNRKKGVLLNYNTFTVTLHEKVSGLALQTKIACKNKNKEFKGWIHTQLSARCIDEAFARKYTQYPFVATAMDQRIEVEKDVRQHKIHPMRNSEQ